MNVRTIPQCNLSKSNEDIYLLMPTVFSNHSGGREKQTEYLLHSWQSAEPFYESKKTIKLCHCNYQEREKREIVSERARARERRVPQGKGGVDSWQFICIFICVSKK